MVPTVFLGTSQIMLLVTSEKKMSPAALSATLFTTPSVVPTAAPPWAANPQLGVLLGGLTRSRVGSTPATVVITPADSLRIMQFWVSAMYRLPEPSKATPMAS